MSWGRRERRRALLVCLLVAGAITGTATAGPMQVSDQPAADNSITRIAVHTDGNATWTITVRTRLDSESDQTAFEQFQANFRENRSRYLDPFRENIRTVVGSAASETGRAMAATNFSASTDVQAVPRRWGIVRYEFDWSNFAAERSDGLVVGDVFQSGFFIAANDSLQIVAPEGYRLESADPSPDSVEDDAAIWTGRHDFADERPRATFEPAPTPTTTTAADSDTATASATAIDVTTQRPDSAWFLAALAALAVAIGLVAVRRRSADGSEEGAAADPNESPGAGASADAPEQATPVSDEATIRAILADHDGEMKQADLVREVDWSKSKVSRVLSEMEAEGQIEKLRIGRENLVRTVDDQPQKD